MVDVMQVDIKFDTGMSMRDILNMPQLKGYRIGQVKAILMSPARINDILPFLHKPNQRPKPDFPLPKGSIFRGQVFGHISVYSNKALEKSHALVLLETSVQPPAPAEAPEAAPFPTYDAASQIEETSAAQEAVSMVGFPSQDDAQAPPAQEGGPQPVLQDQPIDPYPTPSPEKLKRWTEIIPSSTRVQRAKYTDTEEDRGGGDEATARRTAPLPDTLEELPGEPGVAPAVEAAPPAASPEPHNHETSVRCAKEADHLIRKILDLAEADHAMTFETKSDLTLELKMLQMELSKFKPTLPRITEMILYLSDWQPAGQYIARLKECLRGLGLLL